MFTATRRSFLAGLLITGQSTFDFVHAATPTMVVNKDPNCGCCSGWVEHVKAAGFATRINEVSDLAPLKSQLSIPAALASCHTAQIEGYVIEGHVRPQLNVFCPNDRQPSDWLLQVCRYDRRAWKCLELSMKCFMWSCFGPPVSRCTQNSREHRSFFNRIDSSQTQNLYRPPQ